MSIEQNAPQILRYKKMTRYTPLLQEKAQIKAWAKSLREQKILQHMTVKVDYVSKKGELLEDGNSLFVTL